MNMPNHGDYLNYNWPSETTAFPFWEWVDPHAWPETVPAYPVKTCSATTMFPIGPAEVSLSPCRGCQAKDEEIARLREDLKEANR